MSALRRGRASPRLLRIVSRLIEAQIVDLELAGGTTPIEALDLALAGFELSTLSKRGLADVGEAVLDVIARHVHAGAEDSDS